MKVKNCNVEIQVVQNGFVVYVWTGVPESHRMSVAPEETHVFETAQALGDFIGSWGLEVLPSTNIMEKSPEGLSKRVGLDFEAAELNTNGNASRKVKNIINWCVETREGNESAIELMVDVSLFAGGCNVINVPVDLAQESIGINLSDVVAVGDISLSHKVTTWLIENIEGLYRDYGVKTATKAEEPKPKPEQEKLKVNYFTVKGSRKSKQSGIDVFVDWYDGGGVARQGVLTIPMKEIYFPSMIDWFDKDEVEDRRDEVISWMQSEIDMLRLTYPLHQLN